jgi:hypothetical protein
MRFWEIALSARKYTIKIFICNILQFIEYLNKYKNN